MDALTARWHEIQSELPGYGDRLLVKSADGEEMPVTRAQLMHLIANARPGQTIQVAGLNITIGDDGETVEVNGTSAGGDTRVTRSGEPFAKSAGKKPKPSASLKDLFDVHQRSRGH
jgi:hypothetical protein